MGTSEGKGVRWGNVKDVEGDLGVAVSVAIAKWFWTMVWGDQWEGGEEEADLLGVCEPRLSRQDGIGEAAGYSHVEKADSGLKQEF